MTDDEGQEAIELARLSNAQWQDLFAMSPETASDRLWVDWNEMLGTLGAVNAEQATWFQYAMVCIGADRTLEVLHAAARVTVEQLMVRLGAALPAEPQEAIERVEQYTLRLAVQSPEEPGMVLETPEVTVLWVYVQNPALSGDTRDAAMRL